MNTCGNCAHWTAPTRQWDVHDRIGECALGGPDPRDGSSDCHENETCGDHKPKEEWDEIPL